MATRKPLYYSSTLGQPAQINAPDTIDPAILPATTSGTQRTFAYFSA